MICAGRMPLIEAVGSAGRLNHPRVGGDKRYNQMVTLPARNTPVEVLVLGPRPDEFNDLVAAAADNLGFWDNPWDDEDWNDA
jgi:hypothetical protein